MFSSSLSNTSQSAYTTHHDDHRRRKRNRTMQSCLPCHTNKRKCSRGRPCERCIGLGITGSCVYETEDPKILKLNHGDPACEVQRLRHRVAELEGVVRILKGRPHPKPHRNPGSSPSVAASSSAGSPTPGPLSPTFTRSHSHSHSTGTWSPRETLSAPVIDALKSKNINNLDPSGSPTFDSSIYHTRLNRSSSFKSEYDVLLDGMDDHRSSGSDIEPPQPRQSSCPPGMKGYAEDGNVIQDDEDGRKLFLGHAAGGSLLRKLQGLTSPDLKPHRLDTHAVSPEKGEIITAKVAYMGLFGGEMGKKWAFDMPGSVGGGSEALKVILDFLPTPHCAQKLLDIFLLEVDCFYHAWHTPTVVNCYQRFFELSRHEQELYPFGNLSIILAIITVTIDLANDIIDDSGICPGESAEEHQKRFKLWRSSYSQRMASCTVHCLKRASYLGHPSLECIQAQLLLAFYMVNNGRCTDAWCFIGGVIKQAQCLGLHIDPSKLNPHMPVFEQEIRRRIWWSTQVWDVFLGIAFGWPAGVTLNDTDLPSDCTEESLLGDTSSGSSGSFPHGVTELTYHTFNWETCLYARDMMDRIFGQAVWSWGKSTEVQEGPKYEEVVKLDVTIKTWYNRVPHVMRFEPDPLDVNPANSASNAGTQSQFSPDVFQPSCSGVGTQDIRRRDPKLAKQSLLLAISQNTILLLLHRPFISYSLDNTSRPPRHVMSEQQCIRSSQVIIEAQSLLVELFPATLRMWFGWYQTFHAAMTCAWISLLRNPSHPMSGLARRCVGLATETFEKACSSPESVQDTHLHACSQLRAIQSFINRKINPTKTLTHSAHIFGTNPALSPFAYSLGPHTLTRLASSIERGDRSLPGGAHDLSLAAGQPPPSFGSDRSGARPRQHAPLRHAYQSQSPYAHHQDSDFNRDLGQRSAPPLSDFDIQRLSSTGQAQQQQEQPYFDQSQQSSNPISHFTPAAQAENQERPDLSLDSSASSASRRLSQSPVELRPPMSTRQLHHLEPYSHLNQLTHPQLPPIQGFLSPGSGMNYCDVTSPGSAPPLYAAHYALGSLPYQDVQVPLSMLLMQDVGMEGPSTGTDNASGDRYGYDNAGRLDDPRKNETMNSINTLW